MFPHSPHVKIAAGSGLFSYSPHVKNADGSGLFSYSPHVKNAAGSGLFSYSPHEKMLQAPACSHPGKFRSEQAYQSVDIFPLRRPAGRETHDRMLFISLLPKTESRIFRKFLHFPVIKDNKDLVGRRIKIK